MNFRMELPSRSRRLIVTPRHSKSWSLPLRDSYAAMTIAIAAIADSHPDCRWIPISSTGLTKPSSITPDLRNARMSLSTRLSVTPRPRRKPSNVIHHGDQGTSIHRWRSVAAAGKPAHVHPWDLSEMPTTTPCARAFSPHWNASCWLAAGSHRGPRRLSTISRFGYADELLCHHRC
jgi:hypothetical protein